MANDKVVKAKPGYIAQNLPTLLTLSALGCGLTAVRMSIAGEFNKCFIFIIISAFFDGMYLYLVTFCSG